ncbi:hypothetical protein ZIOFF_058382 [Zingiber officinale]|uniref:Uncharacterized protein n=1 Tax=Zingiber officinale TaxID=94328 RepID=A0A8J5FB18_ZINOF|nr:hypothetical protein ZIOFF_058382 [Zingiber officinale]
MELIPTYGDVVAGSVRAYLHVRKRGRLPWLGGWCPREEEGCRLLWCLRARRGKRLGCGSGAVEAVAGRRGGSDGTAHSAACACEFVTSFLVLTLVPENVVSISLSISQDALMIAESVVSRSDGQLPLILQGSSLETYFIIGKVASEAFTDSKRITCEGSAFGMLGFWLEMILVEVRFLCLKIAMHLLRLKKAIDSH